MTVSDLIQMLQRQKPESRVVISVDHGEGLGNLVSDVVEATGATPDGASVVLCPDEEQEEATVTWTYHKDLMHR